MTAEPLGAQKACHAASFKQFSRQMAPFGECRFREVVMLKKMSLIGLIFVFATGVAADEDCVSCNTTPYPTAIDIPKDEFGRYMGMAGVRCNKDDFKVNFCGAFDNTQEISDVREWIGRCKHQDPYGRSTILELLDTMTCHSDMLWSIANNIDNPNPNLSHYEIPALSFLLYDSSDVGSIMDFNKSLVRHYYYMGEDSGLTELREFSRILNERDANNLTFLDNVLVRWNDNYTDSVGFRKPRDQMIKALCNVGATFSSAEYNTRFECEINPRIMGSQ
ncbi:hypothetical protein [Pacificibacter marinus]|uniref:hypothetical protein n=1 Tax=Pacificibacter marinus TaxID=658057 RepID=UPI001C0649D4|nr:hypothetical protein [Pacificibacter marinus]MBU2866837.1 hypothetical protein [Pacificibacter marinus]